MLTEIMFLYQRICAFLICLYISSYFMQIPIGSLNLNDEYQTNNEEEPEKNSIMAEVGNIAG